jgi:hypothetical protein
MKKGTASVRWWGRPSDATLPDLVPHTIGTQPLACRNRFQSKRSYQRSPNVLRRKGNHYERHDYQCRHLHPEVLAKPPLLKV